MLSRSLVASDPRFTARSVATTVATTIIIALAGCASAPNSGSSSSSGSTAATPAPATAAPAERIAPAMNIPAASRRKIVLSMTGPKAVVESKDWADFKREWRDTLGEYAKQSGIAFVFSDTEPKATGEDGTILLVDVADYRFVGIGARIFLGIMTGNAYIEAGVKASSLRDGQPFGAQQYSTTSSAWSGVFAKVTPQQVDSIALNIMLDFKPAK